MKHKVIALSSLLLLVIIQSGCSGATAPYPPAATQPPTATEVPLRSFDEVHAVAISPIQKPSLAITDSTDLQASMGFAPSHTVAFVFPNGPAVMKAAGVQKTQVMKDTFTTVGFVEVADGAKQITPGIYRVEIDLTSQDNEVKGTLVPQKGAPQDLIFHRTQLERNPDRPDEPSYPVIHPTISSDAVCFVIGLSEIPSAVQTAAEVKSWVRYCSGEQDANKPFLSVRANFPEDYQTLMNNLNDSINILKGQPLPDQPAVDVLTDLTISEIEGHGNINTCNQKGPAACKADIIGAPSASFWLDYEAARNNASGNNFVVTEGFVRVARLLQIPNQPPVQSGSYWIRDWFDPEGNFLGTALLGMTDQGVPVDGLSIPATPTYFLDPSQQQPVVSWISGWHCIFWCKWQPDCP